MSKDFCITLIIFCWFGILYYIFSCFFSMPVLTVSDYIGSAIILFFTSVPFIVYYFRHFYKKKNNNNVLEEKEKEDKKDGN